MPCSFASRRAFGEILAAAAGPGWVADFAGAAGAGAAAFVSIRRPVAISSDSAGGFSPGCTIHAMVWPTGIDVAFVGLDARENSIGGRFDFHDGFVGFDFEQRLALGDGFTLFFSPGDELAAFLRHLECGHYDAVCHGVWGRRQAAPLLCATPMRSVLALASTISTTFWLGGASVSRMVSSGPSTLT